MSFGTFNLFNFFQQPNTGKIPARNSYDVGSIVNGDGHEGTVSEMNWPFPYAGTRIPYEIVEGGGGIFQLKLFSDSDVGLRFATLQTNFSGDFQGDVEKISYPMVMSGDFFPKDTDVDTSYLVFSGLVTGSPPDSTQKYMLFSGQFISDRPDFAYPFVVFSGEAGPCAPDISYIKNVFSGDMESGNQEITFIQSILSGKFTPVFADSSRISYGMYSFQAVFNKIVYENNVEDECNISYGFNSYFSTRG